ncbi:hypothetical protein EVAR_22649_1 [Eumeta japonica]|uniref:Uncharacterized protein n=1 Tax=Eumeta variegata TaxID=151549 RepID=A0A4C1VMW9_EUMVA|nr:hypothetical protein EVAR_22649_1 [Eumeta japonica]
MGMDISRSTSSWTGSFSNSLVFTSVTYHKIRKEWTSGKLFGRVDTALAADVEQMPPEPLNQNREGNKNHDKDCEVEATTSVLPTTAERASGQIYIYIREIAPALADSRSRHKICQDDSLRCGWESLMKNVTLGNVTMSHRTRERPAECLASLSHSTMIENLPAWVLAPTAPRINPALSVTRYSTHNQPPPWSPRRVLVTLPPNENTLDAEIKMQKESMWCISGMCDAFVTSRTLSASTSISSTKDRTSCAA